MSQAPVRISAFAPAKINLYLHIGDKRADGFHALESFVIFVTAEDWLTFEPADELSLSVDGPFAQGLAGEGDNLILRAARLLAKDQNITAGAKISLTKNLPVASGIGGGSADAAAALRGLARLWDLDVGSYQLSILAEQLGSDVPACVFSHTCWMEGRGDIVTPAGRIPQLLVVLVNPGVAVSTAEVFRTLKTRSGIGAREGRIPWDANPWGIADYFGAVSNDLEAPALAIAPVIGDVLTALRDQKGTMLARMSGSGATCFAIFDNDENAQAAADALAAAHPDWWVKTGRVVA